MKSILFFIFSIFLFSGCAETDSPKTQDTPEAKPKEQHRPLIHFTPPSHWMNDPNGLVKFRDEYHLFYQHYPDSTIWGPMHWGHATSPDLVKWTHKPIALYPDSLGYIFSGSAVVDSANTSGFGKDGNIPIVAIFTHHDPVGDKAGRSTFQNQSLAYSLDNGNTWTKYDKNPVLKNPGMHNFRDPKVEWHGPTKRWVMTLATHDCVTFYSSADLKNWKKESEFGKKVGAHGGVWECPDLFAINHNGKEVWVLIVSINPGGPNGGSATQYFTGQFDGHKFTPFHTDIRWIDWGPDNYAGVTYANTGDRRIFVGWMSNWQYANQVPTEKWRNAMTVARDLGVEKIGDEYFVTSVPSKELDAYKSDNITLTDNKAKFDGAAILQLSADAIENYSITLSNDSAQKTVIGYDKATNQYYIDRTASGKINFEKGFASRSVATRTATAGNTNLTLVIDVASVELFADNGLTVMSAIFFPGEDYSQITVGKGDSLKLKSLTIHKMKPASD